ncbi:MAG: hypothetical protein FWD23_01680 [Oscillospiraceae bacterium]|nr:hypothetical protein [Oscillospiraceae bacterium]
MKKFDIILTLILLALSLTSCSKEKNLLGNNINNSVLLNNAVCEDKNYIYVADIENGIKKIDKKDNSVTILRHKGGNLNLHNNYLYYQDIYEGNLCRVSTKETDGDAELLLGYKDSYFMFDGVIYLVCIYNDIFCMDADGMNKKMDSSFDRNEKYFICGYDSKYIYIIRKYDYTSTVNKDGLSLTFEYFLSRKTRGGENFENLFPVYSGLYDEVNKFLLICNGYSYYAINGKIVRNQLEVNAPAEVLYEDESAERFKLIAVLDEYIYFKDCINEDIIYKLTIDDKNVEVIDLPHENIIFYVDDSKNRLNYIKDDVIYTLD